MSGTQQRSENEAIQCQWPFPGPLPRPTPTDIFGGITLLCEPKPEPMFLFNDSAGS